LEKRGTVVKVTARVESLFVSALSQSMPVELMQKVARMVIPNYDIYERSGFPAAIGMPRADAARHILKDFSREGFLIEFVESLIEVTTQGYMSREVPIPLLPRIIAEVEDQGYRYSPSKGVFIEAGEHERTMGWGTLREGYTYEFALLRVDVVGNSEMVRNYPKAQVAEAYASVRAMITRQVEKRDGRIWGWEGDGGLAAFYFLDKTIQATLCGLEIVHELFVYNLLGRALPEPVRVRIAVHAGPCRFLMSVKESAGDTIRRVELLESRYTRPGCLTVSPGVFTDLGSKLSPLFSAVPGPENSTVFRYSLEWERK
jgi:class 3 adenylate cyclase